MSATISSSWEVIVYLGLLVALWLLLRLIATSMTTVWKYFGDKGQGPDIVKVDPFLNGVKYAVSYWTERGGRPYQEDRFQTHRGQLGTAHASLYGVFDGHGGDKAAEFCKQHLLHTVSVDPSFEASTGKALTASFLK